jgi:uncharacterized protein YciI
MHYLVIGHDHPGAEAKQRRAAAREEHLVHLGAAGDARAVFGAAVLDEAGEMAGSMLVLEAEDQAAVQAWLDEEPYVAQDVWGEVSVQPCRVPPVFLPTDGSAQGSVPQA